MGSAQDAVPGAVQETFLRAWRAGERFDPEIGSLRTWLFAILRNVVIDFGRARASRPGVATGGLEPSVDPLDHALLAWQVEEALRLIGSDHRRVILETYFRGRPHVHVWVNVADDPSVKLNSFQDSIM